MRFSSVILFLTFITLCQQASCAPKEQIGVFDSNMLIRTTVETEEINKQILEDKTECLDNKVKMEKTLSVLRDIK